MLQSFEIKYEKGTHKYVFTFCPNAATKFAKTLDLKSD
jgi:hypothetical protein